MNRSLAAVLAIAAAGALPGSVLAQGVFPQPPPPGQTGVFPAPPPPGQTGIFPAPPPPGGANVFPGSPAPGQSGFASAPRGAMQGQIPAVCNNFVKLKDEAEKNAQIMQKIGQNHGDRKVMCGAVTRFAAAETLVVKFLEDNRTTCAIPEQAVASSRTNHERTLKFRDTVCAEAPQAKPPSLSDALGTPTLDTAKNTKTGKGTFDTLTGNPLAK
jgi:hypothetical protein